MREIQYNNSKNYYERFEKNDLICTDCLGTAESKNKYSLLFQKTINSKLDLNCEYSYIYWINPGFNPQFPISETALTDIIKQSLIVGINYRFN
jgi:hypothetical protein